MCVWGGLKVRLQSIFKVITNTKLLRQWTIPDIYLVSKGPFMFLSVIQCRAADLFDAHIHAKVYALLNDLFPIFCLWLLRSIPLLI